MTKPGGSFWFTATDIARLRLPGLPEDHRRVREWAVADGWADRCATNGAPLVRQRSASGGGMEYHASLFPPEAQQRLTVLFPATPIAANDTGNAAAESWAWYDRQTAKTKAKALQRLTILVEIERLAESGTTTKTAATDHVARRHGFKMRAVQDWFSLVAHVAPSDRLPALAPQYKGGGKKAQINPEALQIFLSDYLRFEGAAARSCYHRLVEWATPRGVPLPGYKTFERIAADIDDGVKAAKREGPEALRRMTPPQRRTKTGLHALEAVNIDGHMFDVMIEWEDGRIGRPVMVGIQDVYSGKLLAWRIDQTENTGVTRLAFADLFRDFGIPAQVLMDNGRAFASKALTGGAKTRYRFKIKPTDTTGILTSLGIKIRWALPYRGSSKPIERAWRDLCEDIAKHPAMSGAYTGNKPDAKPENYGERAIPIAEFREHVAQRIAAHNAREGRNTEIAKGRSFDATFAESYAVSPIGKATPEQMRLALLEAEDRLCRSRDATIELAGNRYWSPDLHVHKMAGKKVTVRCDPDNLHSEIHVYTVDGKYICAAPVIEATGFFDKAGYAHRAKLEKDHRRKVRAAADSLNLLNADQLKEILSGPSAPSPQPVAGVVRPVRHHGQTAAALKPIQQAAPAPVEPSFIDAFTAGAARLRSVE